MWVLQRASAKVQLFICAAHVLLGRRRHQHWAQCPGGLGPPALSVGIHVWDEFTHVCRRPPSAEQTAVKQDRFSGKQRDTCRAGRLLSGTPLAADVRIIE